MNKYVEVVKFIEVTQINPDGEGIYDPLENIDTMINTCCIKQLEPTELYNHTTGEDVSCSAIFLLREDEILYAENSYEEVKEMLRMQ